MDMGQLLRAQLLLSCATSLLRLDNLSNLPSLHTSTLCSQHQTIHHTGYNTMGLLHHNHTPACTYRSHN
eukprot:12318598-Karenia_brevis.AAC.1